MNIRLNALFLSSSLALSIFMTKPAMADETNKRIEFQFSELVQIPGHVLAPGKYVFELMDGPVDRNTVEVFKNSDGKESLVAILFAIPDYTSNVPDKPTIHFEEQHSGSPEAIHSWFYPGEDGRSVIGSGLRAGSSKHAPQLQSSYHSRDLRFFCDGCLDEVFREALEDKPARKPAHRSIPINQRSGAAKSSAFIVPMRGSYTLRGRNDSPRGCMMPD